MEIDIEAFPQSCWYGKYLSFAALVTPVAVLGAEQFAFPCKVFFVKLQLKKFWAWAETKTGLCFEDRVSQEWEYHLTSFKHGSLIEKHKTKTSLLSCRPHNKSDVSVLCFLYGRFNLFETRQMGKVVQHFENILNPFPE